MQNKGKTNTLYGGAAILTAGVILVKLLGALYKIPLGNILSTAAFADFNSAYYIYSLLLMISTGGLPVALSKMVSEANTLGRHNQVRKTFRIAMAAFLILGAVSFCIMFFFPGPLSRLMHNERSYYSILALSPAVFFICPLSAFRGYFQGHSYMAPTAVSQVIEAVCKLVFGLALSVWMVSRGTDESIAAAGAIVGVSIGCALATFFMAFRFSRFRPDGSPDISTDVPERTGAILRKLLRLAIPITLGVSVSSIVTLIDTSLVFDRLQNAAGYSLDTARAVKGVYDQAVTIYNLPASLMVPLTSAIIPALSAARTRNDHMGAGRITESTMKVAFLICCPAGIGLAALARPIMGMLYFASDLALGGWLLRMLGIASIFVCMALIFNAILQANGLVSLPIYASIVGSVAKIVSNYFLVGNGKINIKGAPIGTLVCFGLIFLIEIILIHRRTANPPNYARVFVKPLLISLVMGAAVWAVDGLLERVFIRTGLFLGESGLLTRTGFAVTTVISIAVGCLLYLALVLALRVLTREDLALMPKGAKIAQVLHIH